MELGGRETFSGGWGVFLVMLGVAVGLGNVWRFPYMMGLFGGVAFLVVYLAALLLLGLPAVLAEWTLGRATGRGPVGAFDKAGVPAGRWWGYLLFLTVAMASAYYLVVVSWVATAFLGFMVGILPGASPEEFFEKTVRSFAVQAGMTAVIIAAAALVLSRGVRRGIEALSRVALPTFFLLMVVMATAALRLPGAGSAMSGLLRPDWRLITGKTILAATGQAFFSLGLGGTFLVIYGSYLPRSQALLSRAAGMCLGDLAASLLAVLVVLPPIFLFHLDLRSGPDLLFLTVPRILSEMSGGPLLGLLFFGGLLLVAFLSALAALEVLVGALVDEADWLRRRAIWTVSLGVFVLGFPSMLSVEYLFRSDFLWGSTMQPFGSLLAVVALAWGLGRRRALAELGMDGGWARVWVVWLRYVLPIGLLIALFSSWL